MKPGSRSTPANPSRIKALTLLRRRKEPVATAVFDSYWRFAAERQLIFFRRLAAMNPPWTADQVLRDFKFTNTYRASDRTSQFLIRNVIYSGDPEPREVFFRTILFKLFNRIETWRALTEAFGPRSGSFEFETYQRVLGDLQKEGRRLYSAAYIMPPVSSEAGGPKHVGHLRLLRRMLDDELPERVAAATSLREVYESLLAYPSLGPFLAFQFTIDLNYGPAVSFDEQDFVVAGPGAREGLSKCFSGRDDWSDEELIMWTTERQELEFARRDLVFLDLFGRPLKPIDCQNLFCEIGKYARIAHPDATRAGGRSRIKQRFVSRGPVDTVWYPPKWGLDVATTFAAGPVSRDGRPVGSAASSGSGIN